MADEFAKGFGILSGAGLLWMILAGNFRTPSFGGPQLLGSRPQNPGSFVEIGLLLMDAMLWFMILGTITFWVLIPVARNAHGYYADRSE